MAVLVACPQCAVMLNVPETYLGKEVRCATCSTVFEAKAKEESSTSAADGAARRDVLSDLPVAPLDESAPAAQRPRRRSKSIDAADFPDYDDCDDWRRRRVRRDLEPHRATAILLMGIFGLVASLLCAPIGAAVGAGLGLAAVLMSIRDLRQMAKGAMDPDGEGMTRAGQILGIIGLALSLVIFLACGGMFVLMLSVELAKQGRR
jgi:hypothetical protein